VVTVTGDKPLVTGLTVITALADFVGSAALVAVTVTVCCEETEAGAVYRPDEETPPKPERLQVTS
jgi:shikimate kinase